MRKKIPLTPQIAPLIDIVLLLLIFILLTATTPKTEMKLNIPESSSSTTQSQGVNVLVDEKGDVFVEGRAVELDVLLPLIKSIFKKREKKVVVINADQNLPFKVPVKIMDIARMAGAEEVTIATKISRKQ